MTQERIVSAEIPQQTPEKFVNGYEKAILDSGVMRVFKAIQSQHILIWEPTYKTEQGWHEQTYLKRVHFLREDSHHHYHDDYYNEPYKINEHYCNTRVDHNNPMLARIVWNEDRDAVTLQFNHRTEWEHGRNVDKHDYITVTAYWEGPTVGISGRGEGQRPWFEDTNYDSINPGNAQFIIARKLAEMHQQEAANRVLQF